MQPFSSLLHRPRRGDQERFKRNSATLGHYELDPTKPYMQVDQETIRRAFKLAFGTGVGG